MINKKLAGFIFKLKKSGLARRFFNNGGCSKLVHYIYKHFLIDEENVFLYCKVQTTCNLQKKEMQEDLFLLSPLEWVKRYDLIDHVAIVHHGLFYDVNGFKTMENPDMLNKESRDFHCVFKIENYQSLTDLLDVIYTYHIFGRYSEEEISEKINEYLKNKLLERTK